MIHDSTTDNCKGWIWCILCEKHCRFISTNNISIYFKITLYTFDGVVVFCVGFFIIIYLFFIFYLCVHFMLLLLFFVCHFCVYVYEDFFGGWVGVFFNGRRVCGSLQLYQRQECNKNVVACAWYSGSKYGTYFLITLVYCGFRQTKKKRKMFLVPARAQKSRRTCFSFYNIFSNAPLENGAKTFSSTRSDIRYRLTRKHVAHSCTGDMWCQIIEAMVWPYCSRVDYNCRFVWYGSVGNLWQWPSDHKQSKEPRPPGRKQWFTALRCLW